MSFIKTSTATIDSIWKPSKKISSRIKVADQLDVPDVPDDLVFDPRYTYSTVRALSNACNLNYDNFSRSELLGEVNGLPPHNKSYGYMTYIHPENKSIHVDHANQPQLYPDDPRHTPRGRILFAWFMDEDIKEIPMMQGLEDPMKKADGKDSWVKLLMATDKQRFPILGECVESGLVSKVSMGCEILDSTCSVCGSVAANISQYCPHVLGPEMGGGRGQVFAAQTDSPYVKRGVLDVGDPVVSHECNRGLCFFEQSWITDVQADPTAVALERIEGESGNTLRELLMKEGSGEEPDDSLKTSIHKAAEFKKKKTAIEEESPVNFRIDNANFLKDQLKERLREKLDEEPVTSKDREFDYERTPAEQPGEYYPEYPFPCSALVSAEEANPEEKLDTTIDVEKCLGCLHNVSNKVGAVECSFPKVVRPAGADPLPPNYESPESADPEQNNSGFHNDDGSEIETMPDVSLPGGKRREGKVIEGARWVFSEQIPIWEDYDPLESEEDELSLFPDSEVRQRLDTEIPLPHSVGVIVPSFNMHGNRIEDSRREDLKTLLESSMEEVFGGYTWTPTSGGYRGEGGERHSDPGDMIVAYVSGEDLEDAQRYISELASEVKRIADQEAVLYTVDGRATLAKVKK